MQDILLKNKKNKCHGNRKLQHFKRKCRARGLNEEEITTLIHKRNDTISERTLNDQTIHEQSQNLFNNVVIKVLWGLTMVAC